MTIYLVMQYSGQYDSYTERPIGYYLDQADAELWVNEANAVIAKFGQFLPKLFQRLRKEDWEHETRLRNTMTHEQLYAECERLRIQSGLEYFWGKCATEDELKYLSHIIKTGESDVGFLTEAVEDFNTLFHNEAAKHLASLPGSTPPVKDLEKPA